MQTFNISAPDTGLKEALQHKIDFKIKPPGALGKLEQIALQIGLVQQSPSPVLTVPTVVVFAGDHGLALEGVSPYPQEVTFQMVLNFLSGGAAINAFAKQNGLAVKVVDAGVNHDFGDMPGLLNFKVNFGTKNSLQEAAITAAELDNCIARGASITDDIFRSGCNVIAFGEMGIANTSSASLLMHYFTGMPLAEVVGRGTGHDDEGLKKKLGILEAVAAHHGQTTDWEKIMQAVSGFEIAMMCGAMLKAAENKMIILLDGFIASTAYLAASKLYPAIANYTVACHQSDEKGHRLLLEYLGLSPLLSIGMRLGEGTGAAVAYPLVKAAVGFLNEMASFESAGVSGR